MMLQGLSLGALVAVLSAFCATTAFGQDLYSSVCAQAGANCGANSYGNFAAITQNGNSNTASVEQQAILGAYALGTNVTSISQSGSSNKASVNQAGSQDAVGIVQNGTDLTATVIQHGSNDGAQIAQSGYGASVTVQQYGNGGGVTVKQLK